MDMGENQYLLNILLTKSFDCKTKKETGGGGDNLI